MTTQKKDVPVEPAPPVEPASEVASPEARLFDAFEALGVVGEPLRARVRILQSTSADDPAALEDSVTAEVIRALGRGGLERISRAIAKRLLR